MSHNYPSDVSRAQFSFIFPILDGAKRKTRPRSVDLYDVFCAVLYVLKSGCQWRMLPKDYPKWQTCYAYFSLWKRVPSNGSESLLQQCLKKISWRGPTQQWSDRENEFHHH